MRTRLRRLPEVVPGIVLGGAGLLAVGVLAGLAVDASALVGSDAYVFGAALLLAVGLYGSTYSIDLRALRADLPGVVAAVTLGVVLKAGLIAGTMVLVFGRPEYLVLGIAVAQIDPLSVAALVDKGRMSPRARSLLTAWASFDDPMTVLLTIYLAGYAYTAAGNEGAPGISRGAGGDYATGLLFNAMLLAAVLDEPRPQLHPVREQQREPVKARTPRSIRPGNCRRRTGAALPLFDCSTCRQASRPTNVLRAGNLDDLCGGCHDSGAAMFT